MRFMYLRGDGSYDKKPHVNSKTGDCTRFRSPQVAITPDGYGLVARFALRAVNGTSHIASEIERNGIIDLSPMSHCGFNCGSRKQVGAILVRGKTLITCKRCLVIAFLDLCREGKLK